MPLDVRSAVRAGDVRLQFQPEFDLVSRAVLAVEALARWEHPQLGTLQADEFIRAAEESGEIIELGDWVLRTACEQHAAWRSSLPALELAIRVNASPLQLSQPEFANTVELVLGQTGVRPSDLCLEVTEMIAPSDAAVLTSTVGRLRTSGVRIALDDFGAGRNGLLRLREDIYDVVKIDRAFVAELTAGSRDSLIVEASVQLARSLRLEIVAEGIETEDALAELLRIGVRRGQGYLLGAPNDAEWIRTLLAGSS